MHKKIRLYVATFLLVVSLFMTGLAGNLPTIPEPTPDPPSTTNATVEPTPEPSDEPTDEDGDGESSLIDWLLGLIGQE